MSQDELAPSANVSRYALDANAFRNLGFLNLLRDLGPSFEFVIPTIVSLEVGFFYMNKGIPWEDFLGELQKFRGTCLPWDAIVVPDVLAIAVANRSKLSFREHFRDFLIGFQCEQVQAALITNNKRHFEWSHVSLFTPEEFTQMLGLI
jgi:predicted nucleic acid-binding protein